MPWTAVAFFSSIAGFVSDRTAINRTSTEATTQAMIELPWLQLFPRTHSSWLLWLLHSACPPRPSWPPQHYTQHNGVFKRILGNPSLFFLENAIVLRIALRLYWLRGTASTMPQPLRHGTASCGGHCLLEGALSGISQ